MQREGTTLIPLHQVNIKRKNKQTSLKTSEAFITECRSKVSTLLPSSKCCSISAIGARSALNSLKKKMKFINKSNLKVALTCGFTFVIK